MSNKSVIGIVDSHTQADSVVSGLRNVGFNIGSISALFPDKHRAADFAYQSDTKTPEGAMVGATAGGLVGGTLGLLSGIGALAIPGLGAFIAAGPLLAMLSGVAAGGALGGGLGAFIGVGIPEIVAKKYEGKLSRGNILIAVHVDTRQQEALAEGVLQNFGATDIDVTREVALPPSERPKATSKTGAE